MIPIRDTPKGATIEVRVQPRARKTAITGVMGTALKLALSAPPIEGRANEALVEFFSDLFDVSRSSVQVLTGAQSRNKIIAIAGRTSAEISKKLSEAVPAL